MFLRDNLPDIEVKHPKIDDYRRYTRNHFISPFGVNGEFSLGMKEGDKLCNLGFFGNNESLVLW